MTLEQAVKDLHSPFPIDHYHELTAKQDYEQSLDSYDSNLRWPVPYQVIQDIKSQIERSRKIRCTIKENMSLALTSDNLYIRSFAGLILKENTLEYNNSIQNTKAQ